MEICAMTCHALTETVYTYFRIGARSPCFVKLPSKQGISPGKLLLAIQNCICGIHHVQSKMRSSVWTVCRRPSYKQNTAERGLWINKTQVGTTAVHFINKA
jgi:hypothetical protein